MHIQKQRKLLLAISAVFAVMAFALFGYGLAAKANVLEVPEALPYKLEAMWEMNNGIEKYSEYTLDLNSSYPCVGYYTSDRSYLIIRLVDLENHEAYVINNDNVADFYFINKCSVQARRNEDGSKVGDPVEYENVSYEARYMGFVTPYFGTQGSLTYFTGAIFKDEASFLNYVETGDTSGMEKPDDNPPPRDFSTEYDPDVPIPQLTNLSHNGFTVANAADNLELDLVVESVFYGWKHIDPQITSHGLFRPNSNWVRNTHRYEPTCFNEIGFTGSSVVLSNEPFNCSNQQDLYFDGCSFFSDYPKHTKLPDYTFPKHASLDYSMFYENVVNHFSNTNLDSLGDNVYKNSLALTSQAFSKYYVRFYKYEYTETGAMTMVPGQWYCYTYNNDSNISMSPIEADPDGNPVETDPTYGEQDPDTGDPNYGNGDLPKIDTANPLEMLTTFIEFLQQLPSKLMDISAFLKDAFCFIPDYVWTLLYAGVGFSVLFLIFRAIK